MRTYTGIGARETPESILKPMRGVAKYLASEGYLLRSGGAQGADQAFEEGCDLVKGEKTIYLPYCHFRGNLSPNYGTNLAARQMAKLFHPNWTMVGDNGRDFLGRNCYQILGDDLKSPTDFIICWTPDGKTVGGTGQAIRIAEHYHIPIFNMGSMSLDEIQEAIFKEVI